MAQRAQLFAQFAIVVDLTVERENVTTVVREHRLVPGGTRVDDRKASMAQAGAPVVLIDRIRNPNTLVIAPAMLNCFKHPSNPWPRIEADNSGNATHDC